MARVLAYESVAVTSTDGATLGLISAVLFHPREPRVVGFEIAPPAAMGVIKRRPRYVVRESLTSAGDALQLDAKKLPSDERGEKLLGCSWAETVIWRGMQVRSASGDTVGTVHDVAFDASTGAVTALRVSTGVVGDLAVGRLEVPGELVRGFDGAAVVVAPEYRDIESEGGAAKRVAAGASVVKERGTQVADGALKVGVAAATALGRSMRKGGAGRKAVDKFKSLMGEDD